MQISKSLNLVIPVTRTDGTKLFVHSAPISSEVFDMHFLIISKAFTAIYAEGLGAIAGPRVANKLLKKVAKDMGVWDGPAGVEQTLVAEIHRLTNVLVPGSASRLLPFDDAVKTGVLEPDDAEEVSAAVTFFILASCVHKKSDLKEILDGSMRIWGARTESLNCSEFMSSLPKLISVVSSGATVGA